MSDTPPPERVTAIEPGWYGFVSRFTGRTVQATTVVDGEVATVTTPLKLQHLDTYLERIDGPGRSAEGDQDGPGPDSAA